MALPRLLATLLPGLIASLPTSAANRPSLTLGDAPFAQEYRIDLPPLPLPEPREATAITTTANGTVWVATPRGVFVLERAAGSWKQPASSIGTHPVFCLLPDADSVYVGAWNGLHRGDPQALRPVPGLTNPIGALAWSQPPGRSGGATTLRAAGPDGFWQLDPQGAVTRLPIPASRQVRALAHTPAGECWIATGLGLACWTPTATRIHQGPHSPLSSTLNDLAVDAAGSVHAGGLGGVFSYRAGQLVRTLGPTDGLPSSDVQCLALDPQQRLWAGTPLGLARYDGQRWSLRHSRRWLPDDDVRDVNVQAGPDGSVTVWVATANGIGGIGQRRLTLAAKAAHYSAICESRHVREPGLVEKCRLPVPGDVSRWEVEDDDNDGGYTALYLAMESFHYAATRDPDARHRARRAFGALELLRTVTDMPGFFARSVLPAATTRMHDPNETWSAPELAAARVREPRTKYVPVRWRPSHDGRWLWKGDTSSDEVTAHMFGCFWFHELAADTADKARVREHVCSIVDHLLRHGCTLVDQDGRPTRWGVWAPERLAGDPDWANERGINSVELLSYLKLAAHLSGDAKYDQHYRELLDRHGFRDRVLKAKNLNPAGRTHIDDELLAFAWPMLVLLEKDRSLRALYARGLARWHEAVAPDQLPFFEVLHAGLTGRRNTRMQQSLRQTIDDLRQQPLDLVRWTVDNRAREDVRIVRRPELEKHQTDRLLPAAERGTPRTDENPRDAVQGDGGQTESDGVFWLLPYWMCRYYDVIR